MRHTSYPPQCDPCGAFLCNGNEVSYYIKNRLKLLLETVIKSYYRGTTQIDNELSTLSHTSICAELITGSVPGDTY